MKYIFEERDITPGLLFKIKNAHHMVVQEANATAPLNEPIRFGVINLNLGKMLCGWVNAERTAANLTSMQAIPVNRDEVFYSESE